MGMILHFPNLKADNERANSTGTIVLDDQNVQHQCLDVFPRNDAANPIFVSGGSSAVDVVATKYHDCAVQGINSSAGAFVAVGDGLAMPSDVIELNVNAAFGQPLEFRLGADAAAAAAAPTKFITNKGAAVTLSVQIPSGSFLWVRSLDAAVSSGLMALNLMGIP